MESLMPSERLPAGFPPARFSSDRPLRPLPSPLDPRPLAGSPAPPPLYGFDNLDRHNVVLIDGTIGSYFALPPDYPVADRLIPFDPRPVGFSLEGGPGPSYLKRKHGEEEEEIDRHRQNVIENPNGFLTRAVDLPPMKQARLGGDDDVPRLAGERDQLDVERAFLLFSKLVNEKPWRENYLEEGKRASLKCIACGRASKEFSDVHSLIMHTYNSKNVDLRVNHLGLHKALCVLMGWDYAKIPDNSKGYQSISFDDVEANREDLILWPPAVIIHNTVSEKEKGHPLKGFSQDEMDAKLQEIGVRGGQSRPLNTKAAQLSAMLVEFAMTRAGLKEAERLAYFFGSDKRGRKGWARAQLSQLGGDDGDERNPALVQVDKVTGVKQRVLYGYLLTASDIEMLGSKKRKNAVIKSRRELNDSRLER